MNIPLIVLVIAVAMVAVERLVPARRREVDARWWLRAALLNGAQAAVAYIGAITWDAWLGGAGSIVSLEASIGMEVLVGYLLITFVYYWWHRARHESVFLWRWLHRVHHSPTRLEVITSFYKHPFELIANGVLSSTLLMVVLGLSPTAIAGTVLITGLAELFYHWNVRTPVWLGWFFQRPEMHRVHHERGVHTSNFSDLPLWDLLFGTYRNPPIDDVVCGFPEEQRLGALLLARPVRED
ncbi:MAG: sterol desaturase family protein [Pseudomonadaceae bacterium]|nr:sterol desaturase family protein [Pseudomonadaceae bacterium]